MNLRLKALAIFVVLIGHGSTLYSLDTFEMRYVATIKDANRQYQQILTQRQQQRGRKGLCPQPWESFNCITGKLDVSAAIEFEENSAWPASYILPPYPAFKAAWRPEDHHAKANDFITQLMADKTIYGLMPVDQILNGGEILKRWLALADAEEPFNCDSFGCSVIVYTRGPQISPQTKQLSYCTTARVGAVKGAPSDCYLIAIINGRLPWILAAQAVVQPPAIGGEGVEDLELRIAGLSKETITSLLLGSLQSAPLSLLVRNTPNGGVVGIARKRRSPVLLGRNEIVTIRFDFSGYGEALGLGQYNAIALVTTIYVNDQNTSSDVEYHLPSEGQQTQYVKAVVTSVRTALQNVCPRGKWNGDTDFICR